MRLAFDLGLHVDPDSYVEQGVFTAIFVIPFFSTAISVVFIALHVFFAIVLAADFLACFTSLSSFDYFKKI